MPRRRPPKQDPSSVEDQIALKWIDEVETVAKAIAAEDMAPPDSDKVGETEAIRLFGQRDPLVDYDQLVLALQQGLPPEAAQQLQLVIERPELGELFTQPQPPEMASILAGLAEYPYRLGMVVDRTDDPDEQVRVAERYKRGWLKSLGRLPDASAGSVQPDPSVIQSPRGGVL